MADDFSGLRLELKKAEALKTASDSEKLENIISTGKLCRAYFPLLNLIGITPQRIAADRGEGVPLEYLMGIAPFMGFLFECSPETLIPREDTELLVRVTLSFIEKLRRKSGATLKIVEVGTGCGNIAVALAALSGGTSIIASDISEEAVEIAQRNVLRYGLEDRIDVMCGDMLDSLRGGGLENQVDMVVCNPPYIPTGSLKNLAREITENEPVLALDAGSYGIDIFRRLITESTEFLRPDGKLVFEIGAGQHRLVERMISRSEEYTDMRLYDYNGIYRVISAVRKT